MVFILSVTFYTGHEHYEADKNKRRNTYAIFIIFIVSTIFCTPVWNKIVVEKCEIDYNDK